MRSLATLETLLLGLFVSGAMLVSPTSPLRAGHINGGEGHGGGGGGEEPPPVRGIKFVFASSTFGDGDLGGLEGADAECNFLAGTASQPGEFVAWLSTSSIDAVDRLAGSDGPWFSTDGKMVATSLADLIDPARKRIHTTIDFDEAGLPTGAVRDVWTGTLRDGTGGGAYCGDWTSGLAGDSGVAGIADGAANGRWTQEDFSSIIPDHPCDLDRRIYCIER